MVQVLIHFALRLAVSKTQGNQKLEMHWVIPNWTWTFLTVKSTLAIYTKYLPMRSKFWSVSLYDQGFPRYCTFYNTPLTNMLNVPPPKKKPKIQNLKFHNSLYNFGRDPSWEYAWFFWSKSVLHFQTRCRLRVFSPIWSHVNENEEKWAKIQNLKFCQSLHKFGRDPP